MAASKSTSRREADTVLRERSLAVISDTHQIRELVECARARLADSQGLDRVVEQAEARVTAIALLEQAADRLYLHVGRVAGLAFPDSERQSMVQR